MTKTNKFGTKELCLLGLMAAIVVLMSATPLGYLKIGTLSVSLLMIPVSIAAIALGPVGGAIIGAVFGFTSFAQCFGADPFGTALASYNIVATFASCVLARVLAGAGAGFVFKLLSKKTNDYVAYPVTGIVAALLNTLFFMGSLVLFFGNTPEVAGWKGDLNFFAFLVVAVGINMIIEPVAAGLVTAGVGTALNKAKFIGVNAA
ncbi:MAG: ECF transporter S component [Oscillospiraceae bacterium]|nr:ECF transporter S component [Oscillospiraceae bacterium]